MIKTKLLILASIFTSVCFAQNKMDTVNIYWQDGQLKYISICCFIDTINSIDGKPELIQSRSFQLWDKTGQEIVLAEYLQNYKDIVILKETKGKGNDESEYRRLIVLADKAFYSIDIKNVISINKAIRYYVQAMKIIPESTYPNHKLEEIDELTKNKAH